MSKQDRTEEKKPVHLHITSGASGGSNFVDWEEWAHYSMLKEYGDYGKFIRRGRHFVEEAGPLPTGEAGSMELERVPKTSEESTRSESHSTQPREPLNFNDQPVAVSHIQLNLESR